MSLQPVPDAPVMGSVSEGEHPAVRVTLCHPECHGPRAIASPQGGCCCRGQPCAWSYKPGSRTPKERWGGVPRDVPHPLSRDPEGLDGGDRTGREEGARGARFHPFPSVPPRSPAPQPRLCGAPRCPSPRGRVTSQRGNRTSQPSQVTVMVCGGGRFCRNLGGWTSPPSTAHQPPASSWPPIAAPPSPCLPAHSSC